jgi:hypothetical protein
VGLRDEHDVNVVVRDECFRLAHMSCQANIVLQSEAKEVILTCSRVTQPPTLRRGPVQM